MAQTPKLDFKMLVVPAVLFFGKKIDFKDPQIASLVTNCFFGAAVLVLTIYFYIYTRIEAQKEKDKSIWIPPKPKPQLPFGLSPPPEPITAIDYEATTYKSYEMKLIREAVQSILLSGTISYFMSQKFGPMSLMIQAIMIPLNLSDAVLFKKYLLGSTKSAEGGKLYNEEFTEPTSETIAAANAALAAVNDATVDEPPRVEELPSESKDKESDKKAEKGETEKKPKSTSAKEID